MADISTIDSFQYPAAHIGHLSNSQQSALDKFKEICKEQGYLQSAGHDGRTVASHDDETLLRYLRARRFVPQEAFTQFKETEDWRKENHLEELYDSIDITEYDDSRRLYPSWTGRRDRRGIPVYVFEVATLNSKAINKYQNSMAKSPSALIKSSKVPAKMLRLFALYENLTRFVLPLCSAIKDREYAETPISQSNNIVDISNVGLKQFWNLKAHMQDASQLATAHYPETLDRIFIIGAPSFFPTVWGWIKRWFDPITVSKIFILSAADMTPTLEKYIDPANIPRKYGGTLDFEWGQMPNLDPAIVDAINWTEPIDSPRADTQNGNRTIPTGPVKWRQGSNGVMEATAVGSEGGQHRERVIGSIKSTFNDIHGISRTNTATYGSLTQVESTSGRATQPKTNDADLYYGSELQSPPGGPSGSTTPIPPIQGAAGAPMANSTKETPAQPVDDGSRDLSPSNVQPRTGTSETKLEQQKATHAAGAASEGTPHAVHYGAGDKAQTSEPATVGQAPKDVYAKLPEAEEPPAPGVIAQAQNAATAAVSTLTGALGAIGLGGGKTEEVVKKAEPTKPEDPRVDAADDAKVEEFLRSKHASTFTK